MEYARFLLCGEDKKSLAAIKNVLTSNNHVYIGYTEKTSSILRHIRACTPDLIIIDVLVTSFILFKTIKATIGLRVSTEEEETGLDINEHGTEAYADFQAKTSGEVLVTSI